jgi:hypothetical protein
MTPSADPALGNEKWNARPLLIILILAALAFRVAGLEEVPPGWRDDELINSLVISQKANWPSITPMPRDTRACTI